MTRPRGSPANCDAIFAALAHPIRRSIVERLAQRDAGVEELAAPYGVSLPTVSRHLKVLEEAGLVSVVPDWRFRTRRLNPGPLGEAFGWLIQYRLLWETSFDRLQVMLASEKGSPHPTPRNRRSRS